MENIPRTADFMSSAFGFVLASVCIALSAVCVLAIDIELGPVQAVFVICLPAFVSFNLSAVILKALFVALFILSFAEA